MVGDNFSRASNQNKIDSQSTLSNRKAYMMNWLAIHHLCSSQLLLFRDRILTLRISWIYRKTLQTFCWTSSRSWFLIIYRIGSGETHPIAELPQKVTLTEVQLFDCFWLVGFCFVGGFVFAFFIKGLSRIPSWGYPQNTVSKVSTGSST